MEGAPDKPPRVSRSLLPIFASAMSDFGGGIRRRASQRRNRREDREESPMPLAHASANNENGLARASSESLPVAALRDSATRCYVIQMGPRERNKESLPSCKSTAILSRAHPYRARISNARSWSPVCFSSFWHLSPDTFIKRATPRARKRGKRGGGDNYERYV